MPWVVGIDEAGYGPNLGPLVQTAVAVKLPDGDEAGWEMLRPHVRRAGEKADGRVLVDDSKKVYAGENKFERLEQGVFAVFGRVTKVPFGHFLYSLTIMEWLTGLVEEPWFQSEELLPTSLDRWYDLRSILNGAGVVIGPAAAKVMCPPLFNKIVSGSGSKATAVSCGLTDLLSNVVLALPANEPLLFLCDKQGGRNFYGPLLAAAFPDGWVIAERESADESRYRVENLGRAVRVVFRPRADAGSVSVALASMLAKYTREVCMRQFNRFWAKHVPGLKPTAGYPVDAKRFFAEIRPAMAKLGIADDAVWRVK